jgi:hypothetical protein
MVKWHAIRLLLLIPLLSLLSSCASIVSKSSYPIFFDSNPTEARLTITNGKGVTVYRGRTPKTVKLPASEGYFTPATYRVLFELDGFESKEVFISAHLDAWYVGNIFFGYLIGFLIVDPLTGAMYRIDEHTVYEVLYFEEPTGMIIAPFDSLPLDIQNSLEEIRVEQSPNH